jgi:hypothetical protein
MKYLLMILFYTCNQVNVGSSNFEKLFFYTISRGIGTNLGSNSNSVEATISIKTEDIRCIEEQNLNLLINKQNLSREIKVSIYASTSRQISSSNQLIQEITIQAGTGEEKISVKVPVFITDNNPQSLYVGAIASGVKLISPKEDENKVVFFPRNSTIISYTFNSGGLYNQTLTTTGSSKYYEYTVSASRTIISAFNLTPFSSEDITLSYFLFGNASSTIDQNISGSALFERVRIDPPKSETYWSRVSLKSASPITYAFIASNSNINTLNYSVSCTGGANTSMPTRTFTGVCLDFEVNYNATARPTDNATCVADRPGTGSVYSASACPTASRVAHCVCPPDKNEGIRRYNFYSPTFPNSSSVDVTTGTSVCSNQNCFLFNN